MEEVRGKHGRIVCGTHAEGWIYRRPEHKFNGEYAFVLTDDYNCGTEFKEEDLIVTINEEIIQGLIELLSDRNVIQPNEEDNKIVHRLLDIMEKQAEVK